MALPAAGQQVAGWVRAVPVALDAFCLLGTGLLPADAGQLSGWPGSLSHGGDAYAPAAR
jgi:hypothetical protein